MGQHFQPPQETPFQRAVRVLTQAGHRVEAAPGIIPGLYHIDGGPELTIGQVVSTAVSKNLM